MSLSRRHILQAGSAIGGGLLIGFRLPSSASAAEPFVFKPNAWIRVGTDNRISYVLDKVEMGQGVATSHAQLVAEELEVDPTRIQVELAPADRVYDNPGFGMQATGGSTSVKTSWEPLRRAGAVAREMLKAAAAAKWSVPAAQLTASNGIITHDATKRSASYGELAEAAAKVSVSTPALKVSGFKVIGQSIGRLDARDKVTGKATFGLDVKVDGCLTAVVVRCPVAGGSPRRHDDTETRKMPGVKHVVKTPNGVAVVADNYWNARNAANVLKVQWNEGPMARLSTRSFRENARALAASQEGSKAKATGDVAVGRKLAAKTVEAVYEVPWVAHSPMEPMNATAHVTADKCEVWAPTQSPGSAKAVAARLTKLPIEQCFVHQTYLGGGFGRRVNQDYVAEAVWLSREVKAPVKVVWSREDDTKNGIFRPAAYNVLEGGVTESGEIAFWQHKIVAASIIAQIGPQFIGDVLPFNAPEKLKSLVGSAVGALTRGPVSDPSATEGAATFAYAMPHVNVRYVLDDPGVPLGFLRSVGHSHNGFIVEGFVDELAAAAGKDPFEFRRAMLAKAPRNLAVLERVAEKSGWGTPLPKGRARGIAQNESFSSFAAAVAEVSVEENVVKVHKLVVAIDCGQVVNPGLVKGQCESAAVFGLSLALKQRITFDKGRVQQSNFHDYPVIRMHEAPVIEAHIITSEAPPMGVGEPIVPVISPAVANAVYAATGKRLRSVPLTLEG